MELFLEKTKSHYEQNLPFVIYKKPNSTIIIGLFQQNSSLYEVNDFTEKGFAFASFDGNETFLIPENESEIIKVDFQQKEIGRASCRERVF